MTVYILSDIGNQRLKIGYTANASARLKAHSTSNPGLEVLAIVEEGDRRCEKALHRLLRGHRCAGTSEWYRDGAVVRSVLTNVLERIAPQ